MASRAKFIDPAEPKPKNPNDGFIAYNDGIPYQETGRTPEEAITRFIAMQEKYNHVKFKPSDVKTLPYDITGKLYEDYPKPKLSFWAQFKFWR